MYDNHSSPTHLLRDTSSRRTILRRGLGLAAIALVGGNIQLPTAIAQDSGPDATVNQFYLDIATYDYAHAYALLGGDLQARQSLDAFTKGYADTAYVEVKIASDRASSEGTDVEVTITSWHNDASIHAYEGRYSLSRDADSWKIVAASIAETAVSPDIAPLMRLGDVTFDLGQRTAGAGHRYVDLRATNTSSRTVLAAAVPQLALVDDTGHVIIESSCAETDPITAVSLDPDASADATFEWHIQCADLANLPITLRITIPGDTDRTSIPFSQPMQLGPSSCEGPEDRNVLTSKAFRTPE